jgi:hypothetical protein
MGVALIAVKESAAPVDRVRASDNFVAVAISIPGTPGTPGTPGAVAVAVPARPSGTVAIAIA